MTIIRPLVLSLGLLTVLPAIAGAQQLIYVVRHAERADGGAGAAGQMQGAPDPPLSAAGETRAARLATMLADAGITAIYATEFRRTQDTVRPLASKLKLDVTRYASRDAAALVSALKKDQARGIVLIAGHSNTLPPIVKALGGGDITIRDDEYDSLFVIVPGAGVVSRLRF
jgi:phosphohistidine phosphatase SixA